MKIPSGTSKNWPEPRTLEQARRDIWLAKMERLRPGICREYPTLMLLPYQERALKILKALPPVMRFPLL